MGLHWFYIGFIRHSQEVARCARHCFLLFQAQPIVFYWFYKVSLSTVFVRDVVRLHKWSRTVHPRREACFLLVLQGFPCRAACSRRRGSSSGAFPSNVALWETLDFLRFYKVSGPTVLVRLFWPGRFGWDPSFYQRFEVVWGAVFFWPGKLYNSSES